MDKLQAYVKNFYQNFSNFKGRSTRTEVLYILGYSIIGGFVFGILDSIFGTAGESGSGLFAGLFSLVNLVPSLALLSRRLHDADKSFLNALWCLTGIGTLYVLYLYLAKEGAIGANKWGEDPRIGRNDILDEI